MVKTIFEKIIDREIPAKIHYEDDEVICIDDAYPKTPVHVLVIIKKAIPSFQHLAEADYPLMIKVTKTIQKVAKKLGIDDGYRVVTNCGRKAGQSVDHLHFHIMGGTGLVSEGEK